MDGLGTISHIHTDCDPARFEIAIGGNRVFNPRDCLTVCSLLEQRMSRMFLLYATGTTLYSVPVLYESGGRCHPGFRRLDACDPARFDNGSDSGSKVS